MRLGKRQVSVNQVESDDLGMTIGMSFAEVQNRGNEVIHAVEVGQGYWRIGT